MLLFGRLAVPRCAGMVSVTYLDRPVYGLPHMHQRRPVQARFVGHLSAERDPVAYGGAVEELLTWHRQHRPSVPLIINTCGWIKVETGPLLQVTVSVLSATRTHSTAGERGCCGDQL